MSKKAKRKNGTRKRTKLTEEQIGALRAECSVNSNNVAVAEKFGIAESTVRKYRKEFNKDPAYANLCEDKKAKFTEIGWDTIIHSSELLNKRIKRANEAETELDKLLHDTVKLMVKKDSGFSEGTIDAFVKKFMSLQLHDMSKVATVLGTIYDKVALASKEPTQNISTNINTIKFEDL